MVFSDDSLLIIIIPVQTFSAVGVKKKWSHWCVETSNGCVISVFFFLLMFILSELFIFSFDYLVFVFVLLKFVV